MLSEKSVSFFLQHAILTKEIALIIEYYKKNEF